MTNKFSSYTFSVASIVMFLAVLAYVVAAPPPVGDWQERLGRVSDNWVLIASIWQIEFLCTVAFAWVAFHFARQNSWWYLIAIGHVFMMAEYMLMLGGYPHATTQEGFQLLNQLAAWVFAASNLIWLVGMAGVYTSAMTRLKYVGVGLSSIGAVFFLAFLLGFVSMEQAIVAGPFILMLYVLNSWYSATELSKT